MSKFKKESIVEKEISESLGETQVHFEVQKLQYK